MTVIPTIILQCDCCGTRASVNGTSARQINTTTFQVTASARPDALQTNKGEWFVLSQEHYCGPCADIVNCAPNAPLGKNVAAAVQAGWKLVEYVSEDGEDVAYMADGFGSDCTLATDVRADGIQFSTFGMPERRTLTINRWSKVPSPRAVQAILEHDYA